MLKLYSIPATLVIPIGAKYKIEYSRIGTLWAEAWLDEELANKLIAEYPKVIYLYE